MPTETIYVAICYTDDRSDVIADGVNVTVLGAHRSLDRAKDRCQEEAGNPYADEREGDELEWEGDGPNGPWSAADDFETSFEIVLKSVED